MAPLDADGAAPPRLTRATVLPSQGWEHWLSHDEADLSMVKASAAAEWGGSGVHICSHSIAVWHQRRVSGSPPGPTSVAL